MSRDGTRAGSISRLTRLRPYSAFLSGHSEAAFSNGADPSRQYRAVQIGDNRRRSGGHAEHSRHCLNKKISAHLVLLRWAAATASLSEDQLVSQKSAIQVAGISGTMLRRRYVFPLAATTGAPKRSRAGLTTLRLIKTKEGQCARLAICIQQEDSRLLLTVGKRHRVEAISHPRIGQRKSRLGRRGPQPGDRRQNALTHLGADHAGSRDRAGALGGAIFKPMLRQFRAIGYGQDAQDDDRPTADDPKDSFLRQCFIRPPDPGPMNR
jgi:hypothetical protein